MIDDNVLFMVIVIASIVASMTFHEAMHAFTGYWLGDDTAQAEGRLTLNPIRHIDPFLTLALPVLLAITGAPIIGAAKPVPFNPYRVRYGEYGAALVGLAGPLTNLVLALAAAGILRLVGPDTGTLLYAALLIFMQVNLGFFVFNMIPFPPLDGSRLLYAFAPEPLQRVMQQIESYGLIGFMLFFFLFFGAIGAAVGEIISTLMRILVGG